MKILKELILKKQLKKVGKGLLTFVDHAVVGGAVTKTIQETENSKSGEVPYLEVVSSLVPVVLLIAVLAGWISVEQLEELLKLF